MKVYMYLRGENPMKYFYRGGCKPHSGMCWFSTRHQVLIHFYKENCYYLQDETGDETLEKLDTSSVEVMEKFYKSYIDEFGEDNDCGPRIIELELDQWDK